MTVTTREWLDLVGVLRLMIGVGFVLIAAQLLTIRHILNSALLFQRTVLIFAIFIGVCGLARLAEGAQLFHIAATYFSITYNDGFCDYMSLALDVLSAICGFAGALAMIPVTLNAMGWHIKLGKL